MHSTMPIRIGLSARLLHQPPKELGFPGKTLQYLEQSIAHWLIAHGVIVFMIPTINTEAKTLRPSVSIFDYVKSLDALVLQGGADISPESYGEFALQREWNGDKIRDLYEIELIWEFIAQGKPVLGICRGCQLINVACGGTLYQDIEHQLPHANKHRDEHLYDAYHHEISFTQGSRLEKLYPEKTLHKVNSIHHQAINKLGKDLVIEAVSTGDDIIEAIRWNGSSYMYGCQWHPEFQTAYPELLNSSPLVLDFISTAKLTR